MKNATTYSNSLLLLGDTVAILSIFVTLYFGLLAGWVLR